MIGPRRSRVLNVLALLQSNQAGNCGRLAADCGISRRTLFRDLRLLREIGVAIEYDAETQGYYVPAWSFTQLSAMTLAEATAVAEAALLGLSSWPTPGAAGRIGAAKLQLSLPPSARDSVSRFGDVIAVRIR